MRVLSASIVAAAVNLPSPEQASSAEQARWFTDEVHAHDGQLKAYLRGSFPSIHDVDDVAQESYVRIWKARAVHPIQSAKSFLFKVAQNVALELLRRRRASPVDAMPDLDILSIIEEGKGVAESTCSAEEFNLLAEAVAALPARSREVILLRKFENLSQREVAARLGISEVTVAEQVYRGVRRMQKFLAARGVVRPWKP
jgi:RNA polymerase sigma factor (sigma-70 family)